MTINEAEFFKIITDVGQVANVRKENIKKEYQKTTGKVWDLPSLKWYRRRKNADIKDALTLEGIKRGFSVRAEKTMGADKEYCGKSDQNSSNRFDLSWEKTKDSKDFLLAVEIEMDLDSNSIKKDFKKLIKNKTNCLKAMVCQAKNEDKMKNIKQKIEKDFPNKSLQGRFVLSVWVWSNADFTHFELCKENDKIKEQFPPFFIPFIQATMG